MLNNIDIVGTCGVLVKLFIYAHFADIQNNEYADKAGPGGWNDPDSE